MEKVILRPVGENKVRKPEDKQYLKSEGEKVILSSFWRRRLASNEVEIVKTNQDSLQGEK